MLWPAARVLARWLLRTAPGWLPSSIEPLNCRLLELGAGIGLTGLAAAQVVGSVCLTDFQPAVLANLEYNAALVRDSSSAARTSEATALPNGHKVDVSHLDWMKLESYLVVAGYGKRMGEALKAESGWAQNGNGTDAFGFNGSAGGHAWPDGNNYSMNYFGTYWSSTYASNGDVMQRTLSSGSDQLNRAEYWDVIGASVRCIED